jgi:ketosteroid isomerase-like protein
VIAAAKRRRRCACVSASVTILKTKNNDRELSMSQVEDNKQRVRDFFKAMNANDTEALVAAYADDGHVRTMGNTLISGTYSKDQIREFAGSVLDSFPHGLEFDLISMVAEDDRVAVEGVSRGEHVSGQHYSNDYHFLFRFREGELVELKEYMDTEKATDIICGGQRPEQA